MIHQRGQLLSSCFLLSDLVLTTAAWILAYYLRFESGWLQVEKVTPEFYLRWRVPLLWCVRRRLSSGRTVPCRPAAPFREEVIAVFKGSVLLALLVMATIFFLHDPYESAPTILIFWVVSGMLVLVGRCTAWAVIRTLRSRGYNQTYSLIVGTGRVARKTARALRHASWMGIKNIGFVEDQPTAGPATSTSSARFADLPRLIGKYSVAHVFIALPMSRYDDARRVFDILSQTLVEVRLVADVPDLAGLSLTTTNLDGLPMIGLRESPHFGLNIVVKRRHGHRAVAHRAGRAVAAAGC